MSRRIVPFFNYSNALLVASATLLLSACDQPEGKTLSNTPRPKPTPPAISKPLAPRGRESQVHILIDELMRSYRSARKAIYRVPHNSSDGCISYDVQRTSDTQLFLKATYDCQSQIQASASEPTGLQSTLKGSEKFSESKTGTEIVAAGLFDLRIHRSTQPPELALDAQTSRTLTIRTPNHFAAATPEYPFRSITEQQDKEAARRATTEAWKSQIEGTWVVTNNFDLQLKKGLKMAVAYLPTRTAGSKEAPSKLQITASDIISFQEGSCPRPIGTFSWSFTTPDGKAPIVGQFTADADGITDLATGDKRPWLPSCLEKALLPSQVEKSR